MTSMTNHTRPKANRGTARELLFEMQVEQHDHDERYHREIARLSLHQRLNHMALHFAKYAGKAASARDLRETVPVYVDVLIIALSSANILNVELWDAMEPKNREFPGLLAFGRTLASDMPAQMQDRDLLLKETVIASGRMASACEKIDHLEDISFRREIGASIAKLGGISLAVISHHGLDPVQAVRERLSDVKRRLKLHGRV